MSTITTLEELFVEQLQDLYSAENQLIKALPAMAKAAHPRLSKPVLRHTSTNQGTRRPA
jgi:ferritin-like metal-binding protein YciE